MDPVAYEFKDHPIFESPFPIDRTATIEIETPRSFEDELDEATIQVIPLVENQEKNWRSGWCTYSTAFDVYPDVEFFCGGVNRKTPTAAAIWRQGNLLHFGFQQSPEEMNDVGDQLLLNSMAYISDFSEDSPIAISPSVFVGPRARPRSTVVKWLENPDRRDWVKGIVTAELWAEMESQGDAEAMAKWAEERTAYLTTDADMKLEIDEDLQMLDMGYDDPEFLQTVINDLISNDSAGRERAIRLLKRYVPCGPADTFEHSHWQSWRDESKPYLFATDFGLFRWYIDPLAKQRGVSAADLRGIKRMDSR